MGVEILSQSDLDSTVTVRICMAQLAAIKSLNCIEKVETVAEDEAVSSVEIYMLQSTDNDGAMSTQALASESVTSYSSCCPITIGTAVTLPLEIWRTGCVCCPCAETWYRFTPSVTGYHTIHTDGILDTMGSLYDTNGCQLSSNDDGGADLNFKIVYYLTANRTYYVRVKAYGNNTGTFRIAVQNKVYVESVTVNNANVALDKGQSVTLSATVSPAFATNKTLRWLSANTSVATVDVATGEVNAVGGGTAQVCAYTQDGSGKKGFCNVQVKAYVESVTVDTETRVMHVGTSAQFTAAVLPADATNKLLHWTCSDTEVATVNSETGVVTAKAVGTANIYATSQDGTEKQGVCVLTVEPPIHVEGITMCCCTHTMNVGETGYLSYDIYPADATDQSITWCSSDPDVVQIDVATGRMTAVLGGTTVITATTNDGSFVASCTVTVNYCGSSNYRDVTKHNMVLQNDGYYVCSKCGYRIMSPSLQDNSILSADDYLKVVALSHYYSQMILLADKYPLKSFYYNSFVNLAKIAIDTIRSKNEYAQLYAYKGSNGKYYCTETNNTTASFVTISNINALTLGSYNGLYESIAELVLGYYCPEVALLVDIIQLVTEESNALDFGSLVVSLYGLDDYANALSIASTVLGMATSEVQIGDRVINISFNAYSHAEYVFNEDNRIKEVRIFNNF